MRIFLRALLSNLVRGLPWVRRARHRIAGKLFGVNVTRMTDVTEVLRNDEGAFSVRGYGERMRETVGDFFLGLDDTDAAPRCPHASGPVQSEYRTQWKLAHDALWWERDEALPDLRSAVREIVEREIAKSATAGGTPAQPLAVGTPAEMDAVTDLGLVVPVLTVERFLGVEDYLDEKGRRLLFKDCDDLSLYLFNPAPDWLVRLLWRSRARRAGRRLTEKIGGRVRARFAALQGANAPAAETAMDRILRAEIAACPGDVRAREEEIVGRVTSMMIGLTSGALVAGARTFASMLDRLLQLPEGVRERLRAAALRTLADGGAGSVDPDLASFVLEGSRFGPSPPALFRIASEEYVLAKGSERERVIDEGTRVRFFPGRAAMDPWQIDAPREFRLHRPKEEYLHFGHGQHVCIGRRMGETLLEEMTAGLFALEDLRAKKPLESGKWPRHLGRPLRFVVEFRVGPDHPPALEPPPEADESAAVATA